MSIKNSSKIGIIFDLDGTLMDSTGLISKIPDKLATKYCVSMDKATGEEIQEKIMSTLRGKSGRFMIIRLILYVAKKYKIPWYLRVRYLKDAGKLYKKLIKNVRIFPGVEETLEFLQNQGIPYAINTTSSKSEVLDRFEGRMELLDKFKDNVVTRSDIKELKPHPESIHILSKMMDIPVKNLVMVGDMDLDINAGMNSGCVTVGVLSGYATKEMMLEYNPDFIIESVRDLPDIFSKLISKINSL